MTRSLFTTSTGLCACIFLFALSVLSSTAGTWQGKEITKDGVIHVQNPATPIEKPSTLKPTERWRVGGDDESDEVIFGVLSGVTVDDDGNVYLLDSQLNVIHVYSSSGEFMRTIGREGEGPGEFRKPRGIFVTGEGRIAVVQRMPGKIILLTPEGDAAGNHPIPEQDGTMIFSGGARAGDRMVLATESTGRSDAGSVKVDHGLIGIDAQGNQNASYWKGTESLNFQKPVFDEKQMNPAPSWATGPAVQVFNGDGTPDRVIERDFELRKRSDTEKEWRSPTIAIVTSSGEIKNQVIKSETDRTIQGIYPQPNGDLWVLSSRGAFDVADDEIGTFDVFDKEGRFCRQITLKGDGNLDYDGFYFIGDNLFVLLRQTTARGSLSASAAEGEEEPEEAEPMSVICYDIGSIVQGKR
jgi:hypothetical protein